MAVVRDFEPKPLDLARRQSEVEATIGLIEVDGEKFIQIDTYGSRDRVIPGKISQSLRLSKSAFEQLVDLGEKFF
jgi:hypothetical protein